MLLTRAQFQLDKDKKMYLIKNEDKKYKVKMGDLEKFVKISLEQILRRSFLLFGMP